MIKFLSALIALCAVSFSHATTIERISFDDVVTRSELVVAGTVLSVRSQYDENQRYIWTHVRLRVDDTLKGDAGSQEIEMKFLGGTVNGMSMEIPAMSYPAAGDKGVYFIESRTRSQINPLTGWDQGHYKIAQTASGTHITTHSGLPLSNIRRLQSTDQLEFSNGIPRGVDVLDQHSSQTGMSMDAFTALVDAIASEGGNRVQQ